MKCLAALVILSLYVACSADVYSGGYRTASNRINPVLGRRTRLPSLGLTGGRALYSIPVPASLGGGSRLGDSLIGGLGRRRRVLRRRPVRLDQTGGFQSNLGETAAQRGVEGSFDFSDPANSILPNKNAVKPTKDSNTPAETDANKINIESKISQTQNTAEVSAEKVHIGETAIVHCTFDNVEQIGTYKQAKIWWTKLSERDIDRPVILAAGTQVRIPDDRLRVVTFPDNTFSILIIKNVLPEDAGQYKCSLPTVTGTQTSFTRLEVEEVPSDEISLSPKETSVSIGEELNLFCIPGNPGLSVWWTAKDSEGNNIDVTRGFDRVAGRTLKISNIESSEAGVYTCHVENGYGPPIRRHFTVLVKERPQEIEAYIGGFRVDSLLASYNKAPVYGDNVNLRCDSGGEPVPTIQWFKDGRPLSDSYKYTITSYEPSYKENSVISKLTIISFQNYDEGVFECRAVNEEGVRTQDFDIRGTAAAVDSTVATDDEDQLRRTAELKGRRGQLKVTICKRGQPCREVNRGNGRSNDDEDDFGSGNGFY